MKLRWKITIGIVGAGAICAAVWLRPDNTAKNALEETRRALRQQGFKIDLAEFDLSASASFQERTAALLAAHRNPVRVSPYSGEIPNLMNQVGENSALVVWDKDLKDSYLQDPYGHDVGPFLRNSLNSNQAVLDAACEAALSGPIRFNLNALAGSFMPIPMCRYSRTFARYSGCAPCLICTTVTRTPRGQICWLPRAWSAPGMLSLPGFPIWLSLPAPPSPTTSSGRRCRRTIGPTTASPNSSGRGKLWSSSRAWLKPRHSAVLARR